MILEIVPKIVPTHITKSPKLEDALKAIAEDDPLLTLWMAVSPTHEEAMKEFEAALDKWLATKSFQRPRGVELTCQDLGCEFPWDSIGDEAKQELQEFCDARNQIVHRGGKPEIRRERTDACIELVPKIAEPVNAMVVKKYGI